MKPQTTGNIGFFKGCLFLILFSIYPPIGTIIQLLFAIFDKGEVGKFARVWFVISIVFYVALIAIGFAISTFAPELIPEFAPELTPGQNDNVEAFVSGLIG